MADNKIVAATIQVNTGTSNQEVAATNAEVGKLKVTLGATTQQAATTGKAIEGAGTSFSKIREQASALPGPLGAASEGVDKLSTTFKALLANPVVLILAAIVGTLLLLYKAFTNTFEGGEKVEQIFSGIKAAGQALFDNLGKIASAIVKLFSFDFSGALADIKGVVKAAGDAYSAMAKLTQQAQQLHREQLANDLDQAKRQKDLAVLREQATDEDVPVAKRIAALKTLKDAAEKNAKDDVDLAKRTTENKIAQLTLQKDGEKKNQDEINKLRIDQINVETDSANELRRIGKALTSAQKQEIAERSAAQKEAADAQKKRVADAKQAAKERMAELKAEQEAEEKAFLQKQKNRIEDIKNIESYGAELQKEADKQDKAEAARVLKNQQDELKNKKKIAELNALDNPNDPKAKIALVQSELALELSTLADGDLQKQILAKQASDKIVKIKADEVEAKKQLAALEAEHEREKVADIANAFGTLSDLAGKQTALGKAFAIVQTTIDTYQSAIAAYKSLAGIPIVGPALGAIAAAGAIATGLATVKKIVAVQVPGQAGGSGTAPSGISAPSAPIAPVQQSTSIDQASLNQIGNAATATRAYVLDSDVSSNRERDARLSRAARLGG